MLPAYQVWSQPVYALVEGWLKGKEKAPAYLKVSACCTTARCGFVLRELSEERKGGECPLHPAFAGAGASVAGPRLAPMAADSLAPRLWYMAAGVLRCRPTARKQALRAPPPPPSSRAWHSGCASAAPTCYC